MTEKRYQVFVSSTFADLEIERQEVMHALLELDCIPSGMELFPAANETQWSLIQRVIRDCDYYILIIGGRYGSTDSGGTSYTEKEFDYAISIAKPIIAFLHKDPGKISSEKTEKTDDGREKLAAFRKKVEERQLFKHWSNAAELGSVVSRSLVQLTKSTPAIGWVRGNEITSQEANSEIIRLTKELETLRTQLMMNRQKAPPGTENLSQGEDLLSFSFSVSARPKNRDYGSSEELTITASASWNKIFSVLGPLMLNESTDSALMRMLNVWISEIVLPELVQTRKDLQNYHRFGSCTILQDHFHTVKIQLRALGLIRQSEKNRSVKDTGTYWCLTPYGDDTLTRLRAVKKTEHEVKGC